MNRNIEKSLIILVFASACVSVGLQMIALFTSHKLNPIPSILVSFAGLALLTIFYIVTISTFLSRLLMFLMLIPVYSHLAAIMHWRGTAILWLLSWFVYGVLIIILLTTAFRLRKKVSDLATYFTIISSCLVIQFVLVLMHHPAIGYKLNYLIFATILTLKLKDIKTPALIGSALNILALLCTYRILVDLISLFR